MSVTAHIEGIEALVREAVREALAAQPQPTGWLDVAGAAEYLSTTNDAIRAMVKRGDVPVHRTPTRRLLFRADELDAWVDGGDPRLAP